MEDQDVPLVVLLLGHRVFVEQLQALVLGVDVDGAVDVSAVELVRVTAVDYFEGGDAVVELPPHEGGQGVRRDGFEVAVTAVGQGQAEALAEVADQVVRVGGPLDRTHDALLGGGEGAF